MDVDLYIDIYILRCGAVTSEDIASAFKSNSMEVAVVIENEKAIIKKPTGMYQMITLYIHMSIRVYVDICVYAYIYICAYVYIYIYVHTYLFVHVDITATEDIVSPAVAPGQMIKHYAPDIPTFIISASSTKYHPIGKCVYYVYKNLLCIAYIHTCIYLYMCIEIYVF
jgi:hypothetical protein